MRLLGRGLRAWWSWSTAKGKRRKLIGFGVPLLVFVVLASALTPQQPESDASDAIFTPSSQEVPVSLPPTATATDEPSQTPQPTRTPTPPPDPMGRERAVVAEVIDGDTVALADGRRLRYIGIDTPETRAPGEPVACFGPEASARNEELVLGETVLLEADVNNTDRFDRLLRYVYLEDGRMVNEVLVAEGYARSKAYEPDTHHQALLDAAEEQARAANLGLWAICPSGSDPTPTPTVAPPPSGASCPAGCEEPPEGCLIKGNISDERIYHVSGQRDYERTVIRPEDGERWFCTEDEAVANGWRKAQR